MPGYAYNPKNENSVRVYGRGVSVSTKYSTVVCKQVTGMNLEKGKKFLEGLVDQTHSMDGKFYTRISASLLDLLKNAENNVEFKGLDPARMIIHASAHKAFTYYRPRGMKRRREKRKMTNLQVVLEQR